MSGRGITSTLCGDGGWKGTTKEGLSKDSFPEGRMTHSIGACQIPDLTGPSEADRGVFVIGR